jgi:hypothetical protein
VVVKRYYFSTMATVCPTLVGAKDFFDQPSVTAADAKPDVLQFRNGGAEQLASRRLAGIRPRYSAVTGTLRLAIDLWHHRSPSKTPAPLAAQEGRSHPARGPGISSSHGYWAGSGCGQPTGAVTDQLAINHTHLGRKKTLLAIP